MNLNERLDQFSELLAECSRTFLATPEGEEERLGYLRARLSAQHNYAAVAQLDAQGIDITDAVLFKLLPHTDTELHRTQGAWLHRTAFISGDLRRWYEASGMTQANAWPTVARVLWQLIQRALADPGELEEACRAFAAEPATKGFQTGIVTPILNALQPGHFLLLSRKSRTTLNYFTGADFGHTMLDYPAANAALQHFIDNQANLQQLAHALEMLPGDLFDLFSYWLVNIHHFAFHPTAYWRLTLDDDPALWIEWQEGSYVGLGWDEMGDVGEIGQNEFNLRRDSLLDQYPSWRKGDLNQLWRFAHQLHEGDKLIVTGAQNRLLGYGTVAGSYYYVSEVGLGHRRQMEWEELTPRQADLPDGRGLIKVQASHFTSASQAPPLSTLSSAAGQEAPEEEVEAGTSIGSRYRTATGLPLPARESTTKYNVAAPVQPSYTLEECADATGISERTLEAWVHAIDRKGQAILYGPPGAGKTFVAHHLARHLISGSDGFSQLLQFHPAYSYEEFIQGLRPQPAANGLTFTMQPGRFLNFCREAAGRMGVCVLIIDEINRANLAQVLGELLYLLEYREALIKLAGSETLFSIPANVRILGTMNTADRSIALVDNALRRRFAFLRVAPDFNVLRHYHERIGTPYRVEPLISLIQEINRTIGDPNFALGISYFLHDDLATEMPSIWQVEIEPYLEEFFFDQPELIAPLRWPAVKARFRILTPPASTPMKTSYTLVEYQPLFLPAGALDEDAAALLWRRYRTQVEIEPPSFRTGNQWRLTAQGWAGLIPLTRQITLILQPKVPLSALFAMIEVAFELESLHFLPGQIRVTSLPEIYTRLARLLAQHIAARSQRGLYRAYLPIQERASYIRGRIRTSELANSLPAATVTCSYQQLTADVEENRILAWTLYTILRSGLCRGETLHLVQRTYRMLMAHTSLTPLTAKECRGRHYSRLNQDYAPLHALCAFFLDQSGPGHTIGDQLMIPFLVDMARLYEQFVAGWLKQRLTASHRVSAQVQTPVSSDLHFTIDLVISAGRQRWVVDTKYKAPTGGPDAADVAQILAYAQVQGTQEAVLVYPVSIPQPLDVIVGGVRLRTLSFQLDNGLDAAGERVVAELFDRATT